MGWWGISDATPEQQLKFEKNYVKKFIKEANPEWKLTIVDCHIYNKRRKKEIKMNEEILKISSKSNPNSIAGAIAGQIKENGKSELRAIGAGAINQAIKAIVIARGFLTPSGIEIVCIPAFTQVKFDGEERTGMKLIIKIEK